MNWTPEKLAELARLYPTMKTAEVAKTLGFSVSAVYNQAYVQGLKKSPEYLREHVFTINDDTGKAYRFKKGMTPWNKGKSHNPPGSEKGRFKPGNKPQTYQPIGTERINKDGHLQRKVADTGIKSADWKAVHHIVWEEHNGRVPDGHVIRFKDGDARNFDIENLECLSRAENMELNSVHRYPPELKHVMRVAKKLQREIASHEK